MFFFYFHKYSSFWSLSVPKGSMNASKNLLIPILSKKGIILLDFWKTFGTKRLHGFFKNIFKFIFFQIAIEFVIFLEAFWY